MLAEVLNLFLHSSLMDAGAQYITSSSSLLILVVLERLWRSKLRITATKEITTYFTLFQREWQNFG